MYHLISLGLHTYIHHACKWIDSLCMYMYQVENTGIFRVRSCFGGGIAANWGAEKVDLMTRKGRACLWNMSIHSPVEKTMFFRLFLPGIISIIGTLKCSSLMPYTQGPAPGGNRAAHAHRGPLLPIPCPHSLWIPVSTRIRENQGERCSFNQQQVETLQGPTNWWTCK